MKLTLKNNQLMTLADILTKVQPRNMAANRGRAKIFAKAQAKLEEYVKDETDILTSYCQMDEAGRLVQDETGSFVPKEGESFAAINELLTELGKEPVVLKAGEYAKRYMDFLDWLAGAEDDFTTAEVVLIDDLLEQYGASKEEKGDYHD